MSSDERKGIDLVFRNISATVGKKKVLHDVSGVVRRGTMMAIMGQSGTGKTTLLNVIMGRVKNFSGNVLVNGEPIRKQHRKDSGYVLQNDIFFGHLTLRQTLMFTAQLRLPENLSHQEKLDRIDQVVKQMDLTKCLDTQMGGIFLTGLSGGERKRANIACELLSNPQLMLIDEPTSGLDSALAYQIISTLKSYATDINKTIITTIHQPASHVFHMFEQVLLLHNGKVAYYGLSKDIVSFFNNIGLHCLSSYNPADFMLEHVKEHSEEMIGRLNDISKTDAWPKELHESYQPQPKESKGERIISKKKWPVGFFNQFKVLTHRSFLHTSSYVITRYRNFLVSVIIVGTISTWWQLTKTESNIFDRKFLLFLINIQFAMTMIVESVLSFQEEQSVMNKERLAGAYRLSAYYLAKFLSDVVVASIYPAIYLIIVFLATGLSGGVVFYFILLIVMIITALVSQSIGTIISLVFYNDLKSAMTASFTVINFMFMSGGVVQPAFQSYLSWMTYISFINYAYQIGASFEFTGQQFRCDESDSSKFTSCKLNDTMFISGEQVLEETEQIPIRPVWLNFALLLGMLFVGRLIGYLLLRYVRYPGADWPSLDIISAVINKVKKIKLFSKAEEELESLSPLTRSERKVELKFTGLGVRLSGNQILSRINGSATSGNMMAVMGPSGAGKTTLLNILAGRITNYQGSITVNGKKMSKKIRRKMGYVLQQDIFLANLTLRQTMKFTGNLKLSDKLSNLDKQNRCNNLIKIFSLEKCLDTEMELLSGGEKKRANVVCELLGDPDILFIDEPTTGLDSALAYQLMSKLNDYATELNKLILVTIHQPSSQIFHLFENLLLLSFGQTAYSGNAASIVKYFSTLGLHCDAMYNPADFILDQLRINDECSEKILNAYRNNRDLQIVNKNDWNLCKDEKVTILSSTDEKKQEVFIVDRNHHHQHGIEVISYKKRDPDDIEVVVHSNSCDIEVEKWQTSFWTQYKTLTHRNFHSMGGRLLSKIVIIAQMAVAVLTGIVWWQTPFEESSIQTIRGVVFITVIHWGSVFTSDTLSSFPAERNVIMKERLAGTYRLSAYWFAKMTSELPLVIFLPWLCFTIVYFMVGFPLSVQTYVSLVLICILMGIVMQSFTLCVCSLVHGVRAAYSLAMSYLILSITSGGFLGRNNESGIIKWIQYLSAMSYSIDLFQQVTFLPGIRCAPENITTYKEDCINSTLDDPMITGDAILERVKVMVPFWANILILINFIVFFRVLGYLILRFIRNPSRNGITKGEDVPKEK